MAARDPRDLPAFKTWFGDSKIVDEAGQPLVVYHGTTRDFSEFAPSESGAYGGGIFLTNDAALASGYAAADGGSVMPVFVTIANPYELDATMQSDIRYERRQVFMKPGARERLMEQGYDGVVMTEGSYKTIVAFEPHQVKSAMGNKGSFEASLDDIRLSRPEPAEPGAALLNATLAYELSRLASDRAPASGWLGLVRGLVSAGKVRADELKWSGLEAWLDAQHGRIPKDQVLQYLKEKSLKVNEVVLGKGAETVADVRKRIADAFDEQGYHLEFDPHDDGIVLIDDPDGEPIEVDDLPPDLRDLIDEASQAEDAAVTLMPKYSDYVLKGGEEYREVLLTLPPPARKPRFDVVNRQDKSILRIADSREVAEAWIEANKSLPEVRHALVVEKPDGRPGEVFYKSGHWDHANILVHIRLNTRQDFDGKRVLFVEEIQSDWGQEGKRKGFHQAPVSTEGFYAVLSEQYGEPYWRVLDAEGSHFYYYPGDEAATAQEAIRKSAEHKAKVENSTRVMPGPFVGSTDGWLGLALKHVVRRAALGGYDRVAFISGQQSADRYDLSRKVEMIGVRLNPDGSRRVRIHYASSAERPVFEVGAGGAIEPDSASSESFRGKSLEQVVGKGMAEKIMATNSDQTFTGVDLKLGGEGMVEFYDKIVPKAVTSLLRKLDGSSPARFDFPSRFDVLERDGGWVIKDLEKGWFYRGKNAERLWGVQPKVYLSEETAKAEAARLDASDGPAPAEQFGFDITPRIREIAQSAVQIERRLSRPVREEVDDSEDDDEERPFFLREKS